jgi:hypothetical protein
MKPTTLVARAGEDLEAQVQRGTNERLLVDHRCLRASLFVTDEYYRIDTDIVGGAELRVGWTYVLLDEQACPDVSPESRNLSHDQSIFDPSYYCESMANRTLSVGT